MGRPLLIYATNVQFLRNWYEKFKTKKAAKLFGFCRLIIQDGIIYAKCLSPLRMERIFLKLTSFFSFSSHKVSIMLLKLDFSVIMYAL